MHDRHGEKYVQMHRKEDLTEKVTVSSVLLSRGDGDSRRYSQHSGPRL